MNHKVVRDTENGSDITTCAISTATKMRLASMIARIDRGVMMETNCSWSIDDSRNKFQFGCERGRMTMKK